MIEFRPFNYLEQLISSVHPIALMNTIPLHDRRSQISELLLRWLRDFGIREGLPSLDDYDIKVLPFEEFEAAYPAEAARIKRLQPIASPPKKESP